MKSDKTKNKVSILLDTIGVDENISMYFAFPWPLNPSEFINHESGKNISDSLNSIRFFKDKGDRLSLSETEEKLLLESLKSVIKTYDFQNNRKQLSELGKRVQLNKLVVMPTLYNIEYNTFKIQKVKRLMVF